MIDHKETRKSRSVEEASAAVPAVSCLEETGPDNRDLTQLQYRCTNTSFCEA